MKIKMTAVAMVAVMIVAAFAVVGMADSGAADNQTNTPNGEKNIIGTAAKPFALKTGAETTAKIEYNHNAFSSKVSSSFTYRWAEGNNEKTEAKEINPFIAENEDNAQATNINGIDVKIIGGNGSYKVIFNGTNQKSLTDYTVINFILEIRDKVKIGEGKNGEIYEYLPIQTYIFTAYIIVIDESSKTINIKSHTPSSLQWTTEGELSLSYETSYDINTQVVEVKTNEAVDNNFKYYATGLPNGLSMTVEGQIGGKLSGTGDINNDSFNIFAVSKSGDVVKRNVPYVVVAHSERDFTITDVKGAETHTGTYATTKVGTKLTLTISPSNNCELSNLSVSYSGNQIDNQNATINNGVGSATFTCSGTGTIVVTISADVTLKDDGNPENNHVSRVVNTFTVYVVGEIFNTDLDPEVTS